MTQIGGFTAVYDMLNLRRGVPASGFGGGVRLRVASSSASEAQFQRQPFPNLLVFMSVA